MIDGKLMQEWDKIKHSAFTLVLNDEDNSLVWKLHSSGVYDVQSLYAIVNSRGCIYSFYVAT